MVDAITVIKSATAIAASADVLIGDLRPSLTGPDRLRVALFLTIAEHYEAALLLQHAASATLSALHVRSMLEGLIAMNLLAKDGGYVDQMKYEQLRGERRMYTGLLADKNLPSDARKQIEAILKERNIRFDALHAAGSRPKRISEDFVKAGLAHFVVPYAMLCGFSHNDIAVLAFRHQGEDAMTYRAPVDSEVVVSIFAIAIQIMLEATSPLSEIALFSEGVFDGAFGDMNKAWRALLDESEC